MRNLKVSWDLMKIKNKSAGAVRFNLQAQQPLKHRAVLLIVSASLAKGGNNLTAGRWMRIRCLQALCAVRQRGSRSRDEKAADLTTSNSLFALPIVL